MLATVVLGRQVMIADKNYYGRKFEATLAEADLNPLRPARKGEAPTGVWVRVAQRVLALTAAIWHNDHLGQRVTRSLVAYDH